MKQRKWIGQFNTEVSWKGVVWRTDWKEQLKLMRDRLGQAIRSVKEIGRHLKAIQNHLQHSQFPLWVCLILWVGSLLQFVVASFLSLKASSKHQNILLNYHQLSHLLCFRTLSGGWIPSAVIAICFDCTMPLSDEVSWLISMNSNH